MLKETPRTLLLSVLLVALVGGVWQYERHLDGLGGGRDAAEVRVLVPPAQARWVGTECDRFNAQHRGLYRVTVTAREPDTALKDVLSGLDQPAACGADDPQRIGRLIGAWAAGHRGAHIAAFDDPDDFYVYFQSPRVALTTAAGHKPVLTRESDALAAAGADPSLHVVYPRPASVDRRCAAILSAPWVTDDQREGARAFLKFLTTRSALQDGLADHWRPVTSDATLTLAPELRRHAGQGFRLTYLAVHP